MRYISLIASYCLCILPWAVLFVLIRVLNDGGMEPFSKYPIGSKNNFRVDEASRLVI